MARNYQQAKIYIIGVNTHSDEYLPYIGSTCKKLLSQRMAQHHQDYKKWKNYPEKYRFVSSFTLFEKFGFENCYIELVQEFPCNSNDELKARERRWINDIKCINYVKRVIVTEEEKNELHKLNRKKDKEENPEKFSKRNKIYCETHKEHIIEYRKKYCEKNKEKIAKKDKERYDKIKDELLEKRKEKYTCNCGSILRKSDKSQHEKTIKHQNYLQ